VLSTRVVKRAATSSIALHGSRVRRALGRLEPVVVVHGGGRAVSALSRRLGPAGREARWRRVTSRRGGSVDWRDKALTARPPPCTTTTGSRPPERAGARREPCRAIELVAPA